MGLDSGIAAAVILAESGLMGIKTTYTMNRWRGKRNLLPLLFKTPAFGLSSLFFCIVMLGGRYWGGLSLSQIQYLDFFISVWYIALIDGRYHEIPDFMAIALIGGQLLYNGILLPPGRILVQMISGVLFACMLMVISLILKGKIGMGDAKLLGGIVCAAGWQYLLQVVFTAFLCMFLYSIVLLIRKKVNMNTEIPLAPFLAVGMTIHFVWFFYLA